MTDPERGVLLDLRRAQLKKHAQGIAVLALVSEVTRFYDPNDALALHVAYCLEDGLTLNSLGIKGELLKKYAQDLGEQLKREGFDPIILERPLYEQLKASHEEEKWTAISVPVE